MSTNFNNLSTLQHSIPLSEAAAMTRRYRDNKALILKPGYPADILALCETFNKDAVVALGSIPGAAGIRIYYGMDEDLLCHAILVAVDDQGADILPPAGAGSTTAARAVTEEDDDDDDGDILEDSIRCPTICPPDSPLNVGP
jgi:hypothetical protein